MGRIEFTSEEIAQVRELLREKRPSDPEHQKRVRSKMRRLDFYISDFMDSGEGPFSESDLDALLTRGTIKIVDP